MRKKTKRTREIISIILLLLWGFLVVFDVYLIGYDKGFQTGGDYVYYYYEKDINNYVKTLDDCNWKLSNYEDYKRVKAIYNLEKGYYLNNATWILNGSDAEFRHAFEPDEADF